MATKRLNNVAMLRGTEVSITVRFPEDLHAQLKRIAEEERRSFNAQIIKMLEDAAKKGDGHSAAS
jgi:hypothetical protein